MAHYHSLFLERYKVIYILLFCQISKFIVEIKLFSRDLPELIFFVEFHFIFIVLSFFVYFDIYHLKEKEIIPSTCIWQLYIQLFYFNYFFRLLKEKGRYMRQVYIMKSNPCVCEISMKEKNLSHISTFFFKQTKE